MPNSIVAVQVCDPQQYCWGTAQQAMIKVMQLATKSQIKNLKSKILHTTSFPFVDC